MQKKLIALAVAGLVSGSAFADSSAVTIYGVADLSFDVVSTNGGTAANAKTGSYTRVSSNASHIGFRGQEDVGNGMKAVFQFEHGVAADANAGLVGGRDTYAGLVGGFGAIKLGTLTTPTRALGTAMDVNAGATSIGQNTALIRLAGFDTRQTNTALYSSPKFSGFNVDAAYVSGENKSADGAAGTATQANNSAWDLGLNYNNGPIVGGLTYVAQRFRDTTDAEIKNTRLAGSYNFGQGSVRLLWNSYKFTSNVALSEVKVNSWGLGGTFNVTPAGKLIAQYYKANDVKLATGDLANSSAKQIEIGYEHSLSKRTILKAVYAQISNDAAQSYNFANNTVNNVGLGVDPRGLQVGIRHSF